MKKRILALILCVMFLLGACPAEAAKNEKREKSDTKMDTILTFRFFGGDDALMQSLFDRVDIIENQVSVTKVNSEIYRLNHEGAMDASADTNAIISRALDLCDETGGALDITIYPIVREWGFAVREHSLLDIYEVEEHTVPSDERIEELLQYVDYRKVESSDEGFRVPDGMSVDLGSVAKGYTGDVLAKMVKDAGVNSAILSLGGNIQTVGKKPDGSFWRVGIQHPEDKSSLVGKLLIADEAVVTSGGYERYFEDEEGNIWWHIIDPKTGYPAKNGVISMTIVGKEGIRCDALSTALFVMGPEKTIEFWQSHRDFEMIMITEEGELYITPSLYERFTLEAAYRVKVLS